MESAFGAQMEWTIALEPIKIKESSSAGIDRTSVIQILEELRAEGVPDYLTPHKISMEQNRQLLPESLDGIAYIDMFLMPNNGMALLSLSDNKLDPILESLAKLPWLTCTGLTSASPSIHLQVLSVESSEPRTSLVVSWNEGYVGSSNGVHALKFKPQLLQVYFDVALQDMSHSLLCALLPMVFFRINAMFPDKTFSIEVQQTCCQFVHTFFKKSPQFIALLKDGVRELFETLELVLYKNLSLWHKTSAIPAQSRLLFFVITTIAKLATCHRELLPRARVLRWHNHINYSIRLSGEELKITIAAYD
ncbi:hypothetical protein SELMODRAFT_407648 [Selaginella moellendorffii]|uniref:AP-5 complex subunit zeta-1 C-terminal TPR domain-containing protein n=1 Tax=Selaginella moellendorffii TaxID=88036 RepID=D8R6A3_SELML|nr:hypothetical protein SELMODRAFT_407648 [Selaginella moellendorffii]